MEAQAAPAKKSREESREKNLEAELTIHPAELSPECTIEVVFPTPMVAKEKVGTVEAQSPLLVKPALSGEFQWVSTRSGQFRLTQAPKFSASYDFALRPGLQDAAGKGLSTEVLASVSSAQFRVVDQSPKWFNDDEAQRKPKFLFEFNDNVNAADAAAHVSFVSETPPLTVPAVVRLATGKDFSRYSEPHATWAEEIAKVKPVVSPEATRLSALVVEPKEPLPVAAKWKLVIKPSLPNAAGYVTLAAGDAISLGDVKPFALAKAGGHTPFDQPYYLDLDFNKALTPQREEPWKEEELKALAQKMAGSVHIEPEVAGLKAEIVGRTLRLNGAFALKTPYRVVVEPGVQSGDGLPLEAAAEHQVLFVPNPPYVAAPAFVRAQLARGSGEFEISAANVREVRVRAKRLTGPELLQATQKYTAYRSAFNAGEKKKAEFKPEPLDAYPGTVVFDRTFPINKPLDQSEILKLNWREVLGGDTAAPLFLECDGRAADGLEQKGVLTQTLVQFTDLGLMQKSTGRETLVFATSLQTGKPVAGVRLTAVDSEQKLIGYADTDANGIATLSGGTPGLILAEKAGDCAALDCSRSHISGAIPYDIPRAWEDVWKPVQKTFVFSDRPLYRPGDTAHFKALTRTRVADDLTLNPEPVKGRVVIRDPRYRVVLEKEITFGPGGSWNDDISLPEGPLGWYELLINIGPKENDNQGASGFYSFRIDDYRPNSFEVKLDGSKLEKQADRLKLPLAANYYMGKPLSRAKASWTASSDRAFTPPQAYEEWHFGDAPRWAHYGKDRDADGNFDDSDSEAESEWWVNGDVFLNDDGTATLEMPMPPPDRAALPQQVRVTAEVTDINEQTISSATEFDVPGADYILGLKGPQFFGTAGQDIRVEVVAIDPKGRPAAAGIKVDAKVERQEYHTLKIATAGGGSTTKDQVILREELKQALDLKAPTSGSAPTASIGFKPTRGGVYFVTVESADAAGRKLLSRLPVYVLGGGEFPWAMEDGARINLQPEKKKLKPGEEAVIVVKTPIAGTALVSVERNKIHRHFVTQLSPEQPVIKVPVQDAEAPNVFVSVVLVRGSEGSPKQHKMPEYKVGYCQLEVDSKVKELTVAVAPEKEEVKPGGELTVSGTVTDWQGKPVVGSEVTLYAVDEGVLSLMKHVTPDPSAYFHEAMPLAVDNYTSFDDLLPEETAARERGNKGFVIGGGGDMDDSAKQIRKNFVATPLWLATAMTDAQGKVMAAVKAPDNLTRYRLMAVASSDADRFGHGESAFKVNKPLMVEPVVPRFARLDDETLLKAVLHNTTQFSGDVEVRLDLDGTADFIREERPFVPASLKSQAAADPKSWTQIVTLKAGETTALAFPIRFAKLGTAKWNWSAKTMNWPAGAPALEDATVSTFEVTYPVPELKEVRYSRISGAEPETNLAKQINPALLEGEGSLQVSVSTSRLYEARDALDYILTYPYGCAEQTTSATLPWLALGGYQPLFPDLLGNGKTKDAVQKGVNRLLQMTTDDGGLAYWPGGSEPSFWASGYGGLMLLRARDAGAAVPQDVTDKLLEYLSKKLRGLEEEKDNYNVTDAALALYTLAKGKRAEPAYQTMLHARRDRLPEAARLYAALAMCLTDAPGQQIKEMVGWTPPAPPAKPDAKKTAKKADKSKAKSKSVTPPRATPPAWSHWAGNGVNKALRLIVYTHLGLTQDAESLAQSLLKSRNGRGEWGNTYANAWTLTALAAYERSLKSSSEPLVAKVLWDTQEQPLNIPAHPGSAQVSFALNDKLASAPLKVGLPAQREAFSRIQARSYPPERVFAGENKGYAIERTYEKLLDDGSTQPVDNLRVGDMVLVTLQIEIGGGDRYLAIDDPLPSVLEAVNPEFDTQSEREGDQLPEGVDAWFCDHREVRADRALFFTDYAPEKGSFQLRYLARVIGEGDAMAPPARIEAMYEPAKYGLSASQRLRTLPSGTGQVAGK
ncbi:MAG TPA: alpha-2-macroglobulin family protein [Prosthecobacter sp.]